MVFEGTMSVRMARTTIADWFHILPGMGNRLAAETDAGMVIVDGGPVGVAPKMIDHLRGITDAPVHACLLYTSPSPRDLSTSRMPSSA